MFFRQAEVIFQPNNERLIIKQRFSGINEHSQLIMSTELEGRLPAIPLGYSVQIDPYKEIYFYDVNSKNITTLNNSNSITLILLFLSHSCRFVDVLQTIVLLDAFTMS